MYPTTKSPREKETGKKENWKKRKALKKAGDCKKKIYLARFERGSNNLMEKLM